VSLRRQLLLVSLLLLALPWAGCQYVREMESAMREGQAQSLRATAQAVAAGLSYRPALLYPHPERRGDRPPAGPELYAAPAEGPVILDGYGDGWEGIAYREFSGERGGTLRVRYRAVTRGAELYLLLTVFDDSPTYFQPRGDVPGHGDHLVLRSGPGDRVQTHVIVTSAPGEITTYRRQPDSALVREHRIRGFWQDAPEGYSIELALPLDLLNGRLGFRVIDGGQRGVTDSAGNLPDAEGGSPPWLIHFPAELSRALDAYAAPGLRLQVVDDAQWVIGHVPPAADPAGAGGTQTFWLLRWLYRSILKPPSYRLSSNDAAPGQRGTSEVREALAGGANVQWYRSPARRNQTIAAAAAPVVSGGEVIGAVIAERTSEAYLSLTDQAFSRLLSVSFVATGLATLGLLAYAGLLSWRIRRLSDAARDIIQPDGRLGENFPRSRRNDEIGELSRRYAALLDRLRDYHDYLRTLSRKLSHELRTPIAIVRSSLDNLQQPDGDAPVYLERARDGLTRLTAILNAMSEAADLEESIRGDTPETFDLAALLSDLSAAYRDIYPEHRIALACTPPQAMVRGVPDLMVQLLDKLLDNAASFAPAGTTITLALAAEGDAWRLTVRNAGPPLPASMTDQLFDSMVSVRETVTGQPHLGMGLHIVRLISDYHGATVQACNLVDGSGVEVSLLLPRAEIALPRTHG
jgi:dedicated sortase system histidine kinase